MEIWQWLTLTGISFEILGFLMLVKSTRTLMQVDVALVDKDNPERREKGRLPNVLGTNHPSLYKISIGLVIVGLAFQIIAIFPT